MLALVMSFSTQALAGNDAKAIIKKAWEHYTLVKGCEIEKSDINSSNRKKIRYGTRWICYDPKSMLFVLNRGQRLRTKADGVLFVSNKSVFGYRVLVQKRRRVKSKPSRFHTMANGTHFSYFDLSRSIGEDPNEYSYTQWRNHASIYTKGQEWDLAIKVVPLKKIKMDYAFRIFYLRNLKSKHGKIPAIAAVEYYCDRNEYLCKAQINLGLHLELDRFWRPNKIVISEIKGSIVVGRTSINVTKRSFVPKMTLNRTSLKKGKP